MRVWAGNTSPYARRRFNLDDLKPHPHKIRTEIILNCIFPALYCFEESLITV
jgi:hypothetical protein